MLGVLIRREIVAHLLSLRFGVTFILFLVLIGASMFVTVNTFRQDRSEYDVRMRTNRDALADMLAEKDVSQQWYRIFWDEGVQYAVPFAPFTWLAQGLTPACPAAVSTVQDGAQSVDRGMTRSPLLGLLRVPDFVYVVNAILSLLAILFMFDAVCGEKESGTLRLVLTNAVPRHLVLLGKWVGGYLVLVVPFLLAAGGGLVYAWACGVFAPSAGNLCVVAGLLAIACVYIAVFFNISLFISSTTDRSATALLVGLLVWVACILVIPNLGPMTARIVKPTPTRKSIEAAKRAVDQEIDLRSQRLTITSGEISYGSKVERDRDVLDQERTRRKRELDRYFQTRQNEQMSLARTIARVSPAGCWTYAATALARTGPDAYARFGQARETLGTAFHDYVARMMAEARKTGWASRPPIREDELPVLRVRLPDGAEAMRSALDDVLILMILNVVFFMLAFTYFLRYDVR